MSKENLGSTAALTAAAALLVDYVMTVAVSVVSGVVAVTSAVTPLAPYAVELSVGFVVLLAVVKLRGTKESGTAFAFPTYAFVALTFLLLASGVYRAVTGGIPAAESAGLPLERTAHVGGVFTLLLCLRAFASGCTALTGVEAISNGVPAFKKPKSRNAATTLLVMGALAISMFSGITALALATGARAHPDGNPSVISQIAETIWGRTFLYYAFQAATAGHPDPGRQHRLQRLPDAGLDPGPGPLPAPAAAQPRRPAGLQQRHRAARRDQRRPHRRVRRQHREAHPALHRRRVHVVHALAVRHGPALAHRAREHARRRPPPGGPPVAGDQRHRRAGDRPGALDRGPLQVPRRRLPRHRLHVHHLLPDAGGAAALRRRLPRARPRARRGAAAQPQPRRRPGLADPRADPAGPRVRQGDRPHDLPALTVAVSEQEVRELQDEWDARGLNVPLTIVASPYREITRPVLDYVANIRRGSPRDVVTVYIPEYVVGRWWEHLLHNQSALRLKGRLLYQPGVMVTSVPYQLHSSQDRVVEPVG